MKSVWTMGEMIVEIMRPRAEMPHSKPDVYMGPYASGAPAIMISSAARMGAKSGIIGGVGQDAHGQMIVERLEGCGVDCSKVLRSADKSTGNAFVMYHEDGSREFIFHIGGTAATACGVPDLSDVEVAGVLDIYGKNFYHYNGIFNFDYMNSGVMLFNMPECIKTKMFERAVKLCQKRWMMLADQAALNKSIDKRKLMPRKYNEQEERPRKDTVLHHFSNNFKFWPYFRVQKVKPFEVEKVHEVLKITEYDDILEEYNKLKGKL